MAKQVWKAGNMVYPLPAVMVSTADKEGNTNIFTVAWTGTVCTNPAMVYISVRPERYSYHMIEESGEFVINLTTEQLAHATDYCGVRSGRDVDKWKECHLTAKKAEKLHALRYIQMGHDEFSGEHLWQDKETGDILEKPDVAVITNSDHIMHMMLKKHLLANISAETFYQYPDGHRPGIPLACGDGNIQYGILSRQNAGISEPAARFAQFLRERLQDR